MRGDKRKREREIRQGGKRREGKMRKKWIMRGEKGERSRDDKRRQERRKEMGRQDNREKEI